jgi:hypothetical protein
MTTSPRWTQEDALRRARTAVRLVQRNDAQITPRLSAGLIDRVNADRALLGDARDAVPKGDQKVATATERQIADDAYDLVIAVRNAVKRSAQATPALRTAIGVGDGLRPANTKAVLDALASVVAHASELSACGITAEDTAEASTLASQLGGADAAQKVAIDTRSNATEDRVAAQLRLEAAIDEIQAQGVLAFRKNPTLRARFERLVSSSGPTGEDEQGGADSGPGPSGPTPA